MQQPSIDDRHDEPLNDTITNDNSTSAVEEEVSVEIDDEQNPFDDGEEEEDTSVEVREEPQTLITPEERTSKYITNSLNDFKQALAKLSLAKFRDIQDWRGEDSVLIECDSLVLFLIRSMKHSKRTQFNFLHYTFLLERFFQRLIDRKMSLHLVVFQCHQSAWLDKNLVIDIDKSLVPLIRKATIRHAIQMQIDLLVFKEWWSEDWRFYVQYESPHCLFGASPGTHSALMDAFIFHCLGRILVHKNDTLHYLSIDAMEFTTNSVMTFVWRFIIDKDPDAKAKADKVFKANLRLFSKSRKRLKSSMNAHCSLLIPAHTKDPISYEKFVPANLNIDFLRENGYLVTLILHCLAELKLSIHIPMISTVCRLLVASLLLQKSASLHDRVKISRTPRTIYSNSHAAVVALYQLLDKSIGLVTESEIIIHNSPQLHDILDEELLHVLVEKYVVDLKAGSATPFVAEADLPVFNAIIKEFALDQDEQIERSIEIEIWDTLVLPIDEQIHVDQPIEKLHPIRDEFVNRVLGPELLQTLSQYEYSPAEIADDNATSFEKKIFFEKYHWHSSRLLSDDFMPQSKQRKQIAEGAEKQLNEYANSLKPPSARKLITVKPTHEVFGKDYHLAFLQKAQQIVVQVEELLQKSDALTLSNLDSVINVLAQQLESLSCEKQMFRLLLHKIMLLRKSYTEEDRVWKIFKACNVALTFLNQMREKLGDEQIGMGHYIRHKQYLFLILCEIGFTDYVTQLMTNSNEHEYQIYVNKSVPQITNVALYQLSWNLFDDDDNSILDLTHLDRKETRPLSSDLGFKPDPWQWDLIDMVNNNESVLVSAPTSSGKTFIAFYCIEKVLRESDDGVVVFVCPSKALVNQTYAEVCSRYLKELGQDMNMVGMFTADDQIHPVKCQVLVTVPACLEILLLSAHTHEWRKNLRYVIFDEVHCINEKEIGGTWEHLLILIQCPFLALSATIGNPHDFHEWLSALEKPNVPKVNLVQHQQRPRDLVFSVYAPPIQQSAIERNGVFYELHPLATLTETLTEKTLQSIPAMTSQQCLLAVSYALKSTNKEIVDAFSQLVPNKIFTAPHLIPRAEVMNYQKLITSTIWKLYSKGSHETKEAIFNYLETIRKQVDEAFEFLWEDHGFTSQDFVQKYIIDLIQKLQEDDLLPAIVFNFSRRACNFITAMLSRRAASKPFWLMGATEIAELDRTYQMLSNMRLHFPEGVLMGLKYGIAAHHGGLPTAYLKEVERLFRKGYLKVALASGTLATGIHMPAKCVVIAGDSIHLSSLIFHQCSGRSGRRGFDSRGRIVIFGITQSRVNRLLTARPPDILGEMNISTTLILRMMVLYRDTIEYCRSKSLPKQERDNVIQGVTDTLMRLLSKPLFGHGKSLPTTRQFVHHQFRFSIEFLMRQDYIDNEGNLLQFTGLTTHLFYIEPYNFLFMFYLRRGLFHKLLEQGEEGKKQIFLVLCHLIGRTRVLQGMEKKNKVLPAMPDDFQQSLHEFNNHLSAIFCSYLRIYAQHQVDESEEQTDHTLPVTNISYYGKSVPEQARLALKIDNQLNPSACSAFALLSPFCSDKDYDIPTFINNLRQDIHVEPSSVPLASETTSVSNYAYALMYNEDVTSLQELCDLTEMDVVELEHRMKQFDGDLRKIAVSLEQLSSKISDVDPMIPLINKFSTIFYAIMRRCLTQDNFRFKPRTGHELRRPQYQNRSEYQRQSKPFAFVPASNKPSPQQQQQQRRALAPDSVRKQNFPPPSYQRDPQPQRPARDETFGSRPKSQSRPHQSNKSNKFYQSRGEGGNPDWRVRRPNKPDRDDNNQPQS